MFKKSNIFDSSNLNRKIIEVYIYVLLLLFLGYWLKDFFRMSWQDGFISILLPSYLLSYIIAIFSGIYFGILIITIIKDDFKRTQGLLLFSISLYVTYYYRSHIYNNLMYFLLFFALASFYAYKDIHLPSCRYETKNRPLRNLVHLTNVYLIISVGSYFIGYINTNKTLPDRTAEYILFSGTFILIFYKFMKHEISQTETFVLGLPRIGKTVFLAALCDTVNGDGNKPLRNARNKLLRKEWPEATSELEELEFTFPKGFLFTKCIKVSTYDYPGGYSIGNLKLVFEWLEKKKNKNKYGNFNELISKSNLSEIQPVPLTEDIEKIVKKIAESSKIILLISATSIKDGDKDMETGFSAGRFEDYMDLYELFVSVTDKPFMVVISKVDKAYTAISSNEVNDDILNDLKNYHILKDKRILMNSNFPIFPCWIEEEEGQPKGKPKVEKGIIMKTGYYDIIKRM